MPRKTKKKQAPRILEELATSVLPAPLQQKLEAVRAAINALKEEASSSWGVEREFSPDGRFLGDVGELIAKLFYGVKLTPTQQKGHDAVDAEFDAETKSGGKKVEVKLRSRSTNIHFTAPPADIVLVVYVSPETLRWGEICNGPGDLLLERAKVLKDGKLSTDVFKLLERQKLVTTEMTSLKRRNSPRLS